MLLGGAGLTDVNVLFSADGAFRNEDFVVNAALAFSMGKDISGVAAENTHIQLFNPTGSGVVAFVDRIVVTSDIAQDISLTDFSTALTTASDFWEAKKIGGTAGKSRIRHQTNAGLLGSQLYRVRVVAGVPYDIPLEFPFQLGDDKGVVVAGITVNSRLVVSFEGREI